MDASSPEAIDFAAAVLALRRDGGIAALPKGARLPRLDGFTIGVWETDVGAPHGGELHPDGDEFLFLIEGRLDVRLGEGEEATHLSVEAGQGCVVPRGVWHKVTPVGRCRILFMTPGPAIEFRPPA
ncbi:cupin domain-containing protein [Phenylobacterium sp.]|uniref:cupin domain-containing protein n=1 Tax=Phenylobacterium sp. TaxID=1871053 RepID=UPI0025CC246E|nr:cupin domain-containing protein [Phenylobacterium sp.]MBX3485696.1 cupin domain-containing protein [Phenylobacterium sp.]MCW5759490.1 cupin domain-containing protein [Phenylobacterium sp.]